MPDDLYQTIGERIRHTRESAGMSQQELARAIGYSSSATISHFESGERKISILDLQRIAQILGLPTDYFLQGETESEYLQNLRWRAAEIRPSAREPVVAFLSFAQKHSKPLERMPSGIENLKKQPGKAAQEILQALEITEPPISPRDVAIKLGVPVFEWDLPDEISGIFVCYQNRYCIGVNESHPRVRQRFSTAHEIGHLVFDRDQNLFLDFVGIAVTADLEKLQDAKAETRANQFAADLLMPKAWIKIDAEQYGTSDLMFLAKRYEVSPQSLWFRLLSLKLVSNSKQ